MIRNLLILMLFLGFGLGASVAQSDIFVRQSVKTDNNEKSGGPQKRSIFLRPFKKDDVESSTNMYRPRLNTAGLQRQIEEELKTLKYWQERDVGPRNLQEHKSYAFAMRAENRAAMLIRDANVQSWVSARREQNRKAVKAHFEALYPTTELVAQMDAAALAKRRGLKGQRSAVAGVRKDYGSKDSSTKKVRRVYHKPSNTLETPQKVFRNYR